MVALCRAGDQLAFEAIFERYRPLLLNHCRRIAGESGAQDAVQQAFIDAWRALGRGCDVRELRPWLFTIAQHAALRTLREQGEPLELSESLMSGRSPAEEAELSAEARETLAAVADLPAPERNALLWTSLHGRSGRDAARELGVSDSAVRQLVFRARARARSAVHALIPPVLLPRFLARLGHGGYRSTALSQSALRANLPGASGMLSKIGTGIAVAVLVGAPLATVHFAENGGHSAVRAQVGPRAGSGTLALARPAAGARGRVSRAATTGPHASLVARARTMVAPTSPLATSTVGSTTPVPIGVASASPPRGLADGVAVGPPGRPAGQLSTPAGVITVPGSSLEGGGAGAGVTERAPPVPPVPPVISQTVQAVRKTVTGVTGQVTKAVDEAVQVLPGLPVPPSPGVASK